ncbi:hypothetical protein LCGC14_1263550, partial [marine sediment metagenome]
MAEYISPSQFIAKAHSNQSKFANALGQ